MATSVTNGLDLKNQQITNVGTPGTGTAAANRDYVDAVARGLDWKASARVGSTGNIVLTGPGTVIDGVTMAANDRFLAKDQTTGAQNGIYCVDVNTEILTRDGWKRHDQLSVDETVLTLNMNTALSEWQPLDEVAVFPAEPRTVLRMESAAHSSLSTMNHRWPVQRRGDAGLRIRLSADLDTRDSLILGAPCADLPTEQKYADALVDLVAWFYTEGHIRVLNSGTEGKSVRLTQSHVANPEKVARIRAALTALYGPARRKSRGDSAFPRWDETVNNRNAVFNLNPHASEPLLVAAPDRVPSGGFLASLTAAQLRLFVDTSVDADGHRAREYTMFGQKDQRRMAAFQMACSLLGISTAVLAGSGQTVTYLRNRTRHAPFAARAKGGGDAAAQYWTEEYDGIIWCPRTANTTWLARRNGKVFFTGNTWNGAAVAATRAIDADSDAEVTSGMAVTVTEGTVNNDRVYVLTTNDPITLGTTALAFAQLGGGGGTYVAGNGLAESPAGTFNVGGGTGILVTADNIAIDTAVVTRKFAANIGDGAATVITVTHNLGTFDVSVDVFLNSGVKADEIADVDRPSVNTVRVSFATAPAAGAYRVVVIG